MPRHWQAHRQLDSCRIRRVSNGSVLGGWDIVARDRLADDLNATKPKRQNHEGPNDGRTLALANLRTVYVDSVSQKLLSAMSKV